MIAATATFAALATETRAQQTPVCDAQTGSTCTSTPSPIAVATTTAAVRPCATESPAAHLVSA
jgi:hypothetical protein